MKKHILFLLAAVFVMTACNQQKTFKVNVSLANGNEKTVYLQKFVDNVPVTIDSAVIMDEKAVLTAPIDNPQILYALKVKDKRGSMPFFADKGMLSDNKVMFPLKSLAVSRSFQRPLYMFGGL